LDFAKILEAVINKKPIIFGSEYFEKDMFIFEELHGDIFDIAAEGLEQGEREDDIFHVDFLWCDFGEVEEEFFTIHFTEKGVEKGLLIFSGEGFFLDLASFFDDCKLMVNIFEVACDVGQCLVAKRPEALKEILRRQVIILIFFEFQVDYRSVESDFGDHLVMVESFEESFFRTVRVAQGMVIDKADFTDVDDVLEVDIGKEFGGREFLFFEERGFFFDRLELGMELVGFLIYGLRGVCILLH
jgi:hypothetical protein